MDKQEAKQFLSDFFSLNDFDKKELESDSYLDCSCADHRLDGFQTKFEFFDKFCLIHHLPYYKGERLGDASSEWIQYSDFEEYVKGEF